MGSTVVFTVPLDPDGEVTVADDAHREPSTTAFRAAVRGAFRGRAWRVGALVTLVTPAPLGVLSYALVPGVGRYAGLVAAVATVLFVAAAYLGTTARVTAPLRAAEALATVAGHALAAVALLGAAVPTLLWAFLAAEPDESVVVPAVIVLVCVAVMGCAVGTAIVNARRWRRPTSAAVVASLLVAVVPLFAFVATLPWVTVTETVTQHSFVAQSTERFGQTLPSYICATEHVSMTRAHTERTGWLLSATPAVWVIDAPLAATADLVTADGSSAKGALAHVRSLRAGPPDAEGYCIQPTSLGQPNAARYERYEAGAVHGLGLAVLWATLGVGIATAVATWRSRR